MRALELICEGISPVVFHATNFPAAVKILSNDTLRSAAEEISFTRSLQGSYHKNNKLVGIIFKLDGRKLNMNYKGGPVGTEDYDLDDNLTYSGKSNKQLEDRIYSGEIKNFSKYVDSAIVYVPEEYLENYADEFDDDYDTQLKSAKEALQLLKSNGIEYRIVASEKGLVNPKTNDEETFDNILNPQESFEVDYYAYNDETDEGKDVQVTIKATDENAAYKKAEELMPKVAQEYGINPAHLSIMGVMEI